MTEEKVSLDGLSGHALFHFWEVAVGICSASALARDFPRGHSAPVAFISNERLWDERSEEQGRQDWRKLRQRPGRKLRVCVLSRRSRVASVPYKWRRSAHVDLATLTHSAKAAACPTGVPVASARFHTDALAIWKRLPVADMRMPA